MDVYDTTLGAYERHRNITAWYADGELDKVQWPSDEVKALFVKDAAGPPGDQEPSGSSAPAGAIAGGAIGGIVGLAAIAGLIWFLIKRKRQHSSPEEHTELQDPPPITRTPQQLETAEVSSDSANTIQVKRPVYSGHAELPQRHAHAELPPNEVPAFAAELEAGRGGSRSLG
jgi:hypothetical protein